MKFNPLKVISKAVVMIRIDISGEMDADGAREVARQTNLVIAYGKRRFLILVGIGLCFLFVCFGISLIKWW